jgi:hypothetical protein
MAKKNEIERDVERGARMTEQTAATISKALDKLFSNLPMYAARDMATVRLVRELTRLQPALMQTIMEGRWAREAHEASMAEIPASPARTDF